MNGIGDAIAAADGIHSRIHTELRRSDNKVKNAQEVKASAEARRVAISAVNSTIAYLENCISKLRAANVPRSPRKGPREGVERRDVIPPNPLGDELPEDGERFLKQISGDDDEGFGSQAPDMEEMAEAIGPIMDNFDQVLQKPYLDNHSAILNTVPVLGLKDGNQIKYLSVDAGSESITETWKAFGPLPGGAASDPSKVHFFPYKGNLYVANGLAVWKKSPRARDDPTLKEANDDWSKMYVNEWVKVGDSVLPANDLQSVVTFAKLDDAGEVMDFKLLILEKSGTIKVLTKDDIYPSNTWETVRYDGSGSPPKWTRLAYRNQKLIGLDDGNNTWDITYDNKNHTYKPENRTSIEKVTDFTATDSGLVVIREDGYVYRREVEAPTGGSSEPTVRWNKVIARDGVTRLGPGAPGVMLDLNALTQALRSRYISAQKVAIPTINSIAACAESYDVHISLVLEAQKEWAAARGDDEKQAIALDVAYQELDQAIIWSDDLSNTLEESGLDVAAMAVQLKKVRTDLEQQLTVLKNRLVGLRKTLEDQEDAMSQLKAAFWGAVAGALFGLALGVIGLFFGANPTVLKAAGALFVASVVAAISLGQQIAEMRKAITDTEAQIEVTERAITELSSIVQNYSNLDEMYGKMTAFWGTLYLTSERVDAFEEAIMKLIGRGRLSSPANIIAAQQAMARILAAANKYLQVLVEQGIELPQMKVSTSYTALLESKPSVLLALSFLELNSLRTQEIKEGVRLLASRDIAAYRQRLRNAKAIALLATAAKRRERILSDSWYNVALLQANAEMFELSSRNDSKHGGDEYNDMVSKTRMVARGTIQFLESVEELCQKIQDLLNKYSGDQQIIQVDDPILDEAIELCIEARAQAGCAHNGFAEINEVARIFQNRLQREIEKFNIIIQQHRAAEAEERDQAKKEYPPVWWTQSRAAWIAYLQGQIGFKYNYIVGTIEKNDINPRRDAQQSGSKFDGNSLTWKEMVTKVNGATGEIALSLDRIKKWISMDPERMKRILDAKWKLIAADTAVVREILEGYTRALRATLVHGPDHDRLVTVVSLSPMITDGIASQGTRLDTAIAKVDRAMRLPQVRGLMGVCEDDGSRRASLLEALAATRNGLAEMTALMEKGVRTLTLMGSRQRYAVQDVVQGKMSLREFVEYNIDSAAPAIRAAAAAAERWHALSTSYKRCMDYVRMTVNVVERRLSDAKAPINVPDGDKKVKEHTKVYGILADAITQTFVSGSVFMPVPASIQICAALNVANARGWSTSKTSYAVRTVLETLPREEIEQLVNKFTELKSELDSAVQQLEELMPVLAPVGDGANQLASLAEEMVDRMRALLNDGNMVDQVKLTEEDARKIEESWTKAAPAKV